METFIILISLMLLLFILNIVLLLKSKKYLPFIIILDVLFLTFIGYKIYLNVGYANYSIKLMPESFQILGIYSINSDNDFYLLIFEEETNKPKLFYFSPENAEKAKELKQKYTQISQNGIVMGKIDNPLMSYPNLEFQLRDLSKTESK